MHLKHNPAQSADKRVDSGMHLMTLAPTGQKPIDGAVHNIDHVTLHTKVGMVSGTIISQRRCRCLVKLNTDLWPERLIVVVAIKRSYQRQRRLLPCIAGEIEANIFISVASV
jgi:hypothetical protein